MKTEVYIYQCHVCFSDYANLENQVTGPISMITRPYSDIRSQKETGASSCLARSLMLA